MTYGGQRHTRFRTRKTAELLAYLAYFRRHAHPREVLVEMLWPECDTDSGRHNLSMALSSLRQQLENREEGTRDKGQETRHKDLPMENTDSAGGGPLFLVDRHTIGLNPAAVATDAADFEMALADAYQAGSGYERARLLGKAADLYTGELLPGYYEDWIFPEQQRMAELYFQALQEMIVHCELEGDYAAALQHALRALRQEPRRQEAHRQVMRLHALNGQPDAALRQLQELERRLQTDGEETPEEETCRLADAIRTRAIKPSPKTQSVPPIPHGGTRSPAFNDTLGTDGVAPSVGLEPVGGAVPLESKFYVVRPADEAFRAALQRRDSIVLIKGARQVGKTSLLARGLQQAREMGFRVVLTHFQVLNAAHLESPETLLFALAEMFAEQLDLNVPPSEDWQAKRGANPNFRRYLRREALGKLSVPLVWGMDEMDRLFACPFRGEIFALFRSWHDERALDPGGPWSGLTLAIAYSTEAHLFISDLNQSPFNVGTPLQLDDFTLDQVADLNRRHGSPLKQEREIARFVEVVGGQPYLVRRGLHEMAAQGIGIPEFEARAEQDDWIFGDHLRRILSLLIRDITLNEAMQGLLQNRAAPDRDSFYRLRSAGVIVGDSPGKAQVRCPLYRNYLQQCLSRVE